MNAMTFWTFGCAVWDPQLGLRALNSQQEGTHSFASDPEGTSREMPLSYVWQPAEAHQSTANRTQISKIHHQNMDLSSACGLNYVLCWYFDLWLTESRVLGKYFKTIEVNWSKRALGEKTLAQAESCAVIYEVLGGILCLCGDSAINLFLILENKAQLGRLSPRAALTSTGAQEDKYQLLLSRGLFRQ